MDPHNTLIYILVNAIPAILAITLHEAAHGYVARHFGDATAYMMGRVTLNPLKHIDLVGTIIFPLACVLMGGAIFGWAKPVPVNYANLRHPRGDSFWVAAAGPGSNLLQAVLWGFAAVLLKDAQSLPGQFWLAVAASGIGWNVAIAIFNLFPILPLDGGRMLASVLPKRLAYAYSRLEPYGMFVLLAFIVALSVIPSVRAAFSALLSGATDLFFTAFGLE